MASGHANRANRPNTWLHRPTPANVKILLANSEPSTHGTKRSRIVGPSWSALRGKADVAPDQRTSSKVIHCGGAVFRCDRARRKGDEWHASGAEIALHGLTANSSD